jgi:hypothetical protein
MLMRTIFGEGKSTRRRGTRFSIEIKEACPRLLRARFDDKPEQEATMGGSCARQLVSA